MQNVIASFAHFLAENVPMHTVQFRRKDASDPSAFSMTMNAVNVEFTDLSLEPGDSSINVGIDVIFDDENNAVDCVSRIYSALSSSYFIPLKDYSDPQNPVSVSGNAHWDRAPIRFVKVQTPQYSHYSCLLRLRFA